MSYRSQPMRLPPSVTSRRDSDRRSDTVNVREYGAIADGISHPLSGKYVSLAAAQVDYHFATALTQEIDYCACKAASNAAFGADLEVLTAYTTIGHTHDGRTIKVTPSPQWTTNQWTGYTFFRKFHSNGFVDSQVVASNTSDTVTLAQQLPFGIGAADNAYAFGFGEHGSFNVTLNKKLVIPPGSYQFGDDTWTIRNLASGVIEGASRLATVLQGNKTVLAFDGLWYSWLGNFSVQVQTDTAAVAFDVDGNQASYDTRGVQGNTFSNLLIDAGGSTYGFAMCRKGGSGAQGSENLFLNCHFKNATFACYYQNGFNALDNTFIGGDFQSYSKNGAYVVGGTAHWFGTSFESTYGYRQLENDGWDINVGDAGSYEYCVVQACRTESLRFLKCEAGIRVIVNGVKGNLADPQAWTANTTYSASANHYKAIVYGDKLFVATTTGTSGAISPDFGSVPKNGTIADNDIVWTHTPFEFVRVTSNNSIVDVRTVLGTAGAVNAPSQIPALVVTADADLMTNTTLCMVDATAGPITIYLPEYIQQGAHITIKKTDTSANAVTISGAKYGSVVEGGGSTLSIPGGSRGAKTLAVADKTVGGPSWWFVVASV